MPFELVGIIERLPAFALVVARLAALLAMQPLLGSISVPGNVRVMLILGLAAVASPLVPYESRNLPDTPAGMAIALGGEVLVGALMGAVLMLCFLGLQLGGQMIAQESGLALGAIYDPTTDQEDSVLSAFYLQLAGVVYLLLDGHRMLVSAALDSFQSVPLLHAGGMLTQGGGLIVDALAAGGDMGVRIAAPTVLTLFLVNMALGFVSRTVPQLNIITLGFAAKALIGFVIMAVSLPTALTIFADGLHRIGGWIQELTRP